MAAVREAVDIGLGENSLPFGKEMVVEDEVLVTPTDQHRTIAKNLQPRRCVRNDVISRFARAERDVLHEPQGGDPIRPAVIWGAVGIPYFL